MFKSLVFLSLLALSLCSQTIPLPKTLDGLSLGSETTSFTLEAHYDLLCPDSRDSYYVLSQVIRDFNISTNPNFKFTIHFFPLPYHTYAHRAAIVERFYIFTIKCLKVSSLPRYIQDVYGSAEAWRYVDWLFHNQETFYNGNISNYTLIQTDLKLADLVHQNLNLSPESILNGLHNPQYDGEVRISWKFGCSRTVSGAPFYFVNNIKVDDAPGFAYIDWVNFLKDFFNMNETFSGEEFLRDRLKRN